MEAYDRLKKSVGDGKNTTKVQKLIIMRSQWLFTKGKFIFNELELWGNICSLLGIFFNELELRVKLLVSYNKDVFH